MDNKFCPGTTHCANESGQHIIKYNDDDQEFLKFDEEEWRFDQPNTLQTSSINLITTISSNLQDVLSQIFTAFGNCAFLRYHTQLFDQAPLVKAYEAEKNVF